MSRARTHRIGLFAPPPGAVAAAPTQEDEITAGAGQTVYNLSENFAPDGLAIFTVNGQTFAKDTDFTIVGMVATFINPLVIVAGDRIVVIYNFIP